METASPASTGGAFFIVYFDHMLSTQDIMDSILQNAEHNIKKNIHCIADMEDSVEAAEAYYTQFASSISRNIASHADKKELADALQVQIIGNSYVLEVCHAYLEEVCRHIDLETDELLDEIISDETDA